MKSKIKIFSIVLAGAIVLSCFSCVLFTACGSGKDYAKVTSYAEFDGEDWSSKEVQYQFVGFDPKNLVKIEDISMQTVSQFFGTMMNLYKDGSLAAYQIGNADKHISYTYYGYWTSSQNDGVTTIETHHFGPEDTIIGYRALMDEDRGGYISTNYDDSAEKGKFKKTEGDVFPFLTSASSVSNTEATEHTKMHCDGVIYYDTTEDMYNALSPYFKVWG